MRLHSNIAFILALGVASACASETGVSLDVAVETGLVPAREFTYVQVELASAVEGVSALPVQEARALFGEDFARGAHVGSFSNLPPGTYLVVARLLRGDGTSLISRRVQIELAADYTLMVHLTRDCVGAVCPLAAGSPALSECLAGTCVDPRCNPPNPEFCPAITFCLTAADCPQPAECANALCTEGVCTTESIAGACPLNSYCDPTGAGNGCTGDVFVDAGVPDAGDADVSLDASEPDAAMPDATMIDPDAFVDGDAAVDVDAGPICGTICTLESDPCLFGYWECAPGVAPACVEINFKPAGSSCGAGRTCTAEHECVLCEEGASCSYACYAGVETCTDGARGCALSGAYVDVGQPYRDGYCFGDEPCGTGMVCDENGQPTDCIEGVECALGCDTGHMTCDLFGSHCIFDGIASVGTSCGVNQYCDSVGECVACTMGASCAGPDPLCQPGVIDCSGGTPECLSSALSPGTPCGSGHVCDPAGTCQPCTNGATCTGTDICRHWYTSCGSGVPVCFPGGAALGTGAACDVNKVCDWDGVCKYCVAGEACTVDSGCSSTSGTYACDDIYGAACVGTGASTNHAIGTPCSSGECNGAGTCCAPVSATSVAVTSYVGCYITADSHVHCMPSSFDASGVTNAVSVSAGYLHVCALLDDATVSCWGNNDWGQFGTTDPSSATAVNVPLPGTVYAVSAGGLSTCAIVGASRDVYCWGDEENARTGGAITTITPTQIAGVTGAAEVVSGDYHFCARLLSGDVMCWGSNNSGELGLGYKSASPVSTPAAVLGLHDATDIDLVYGHTCAVRATGGVVCWGLTDIGTPDETAPVAQALPFTNAVAVQVTASGTRCALQGTGELWCWNRGDHAGIGSDAVAMTIAPTRVRSTNAVSAFEMGDAQGCALNGSAHQVICWGDNSAGEFNSMGGTYYEPIAVCP